MRATPKHLEICDRLGRSLARARQLPRDAEIDQRLDRLDDVLARCRELLSALDAKEPSGARTSENFPDGRNAPNVIPFPGKTRARNARTA